MSACFKNVWAFNYFGARQLFKHASSTFIREISNISYNEMSGLKILVGGGGQLPPFSNSWTHYDATEATHTKLRIWLTDTSDVRIEGVVMSTNPADAPGAIFVLPVGFRPPKVTYIPITTGDGAATGVIRIYTDGYVSIMSSDTTMVAINAQFQTSVL